MSRRLDTLSDTALVALYGDVMTELLRRGVVRSANNPIGDMAEGLIAGYYGVDPAPPNVKSYDVKTRDGQKIQVKAMRRTKSSRTTLSALRSLDFDVLAAVIFAVDMSLIEAALIPVDVVREYMGWSDTWKANRLSVTKRLLMDPRVTRLPADVLASA
jgi:hypothetical protein